MTQQEAAEVFQMIATVYDLHPERSAEQAPVWVQALTPLELDDVLPFAQAFLRGKGPDRFPTVIQFVSMVRKRAAREDAGHVPELPTVEAPATPLWVVAWELMREDHRDRVTAARQHGDLGRLDELGDYPLMPEQEGGMLQLGYKWPPDGRRVLDPESDEYRTLIERAGKAPQSPRRQFAERQPDCLVCGDSGQVEVGYTMRATEDGVVRDSEQVAPCPQCDRGKLMEHPLDGEGPWGRDGFWRGQQWRTVRTGVVEIT